MNSDKPVSKSQDTDAERAAKTLIFSNHKTKVLRGNEFIAEARSASMARRIRNALNAYQPGPAGR